MPDEHRREEAWGEPPHGDVVARLLAERYPIAPGERLTVDVDEEAGRLQLVLADRRHAWELRVRYLRGADDPWMATADALDALFGNLIESDRDYRSLPQGLDVEHDGAFFEVEVKHDIPELSKLANQMLDGN